MGVFLVMVAICHSMNGALGDEDGFVPYAMLHPRYGAETKGRKAIFVAKGSVHAMAYRDHHEEYTRIVKDFVSKGE